MKIFIWIGMIMLVICAPISIMTSIEKQQDREMVPQRPLIVVTYEPYEIASTEQGVRYKVIDMKGNIFYFSEPLGYKEKPEYMLGDTIK